MTYYLVTLDRESGSIQLDPFGDEADALEALRVREAARKASQEIVLFIADSEDELRRTHSRFFLGVEQIGERLRHELELQTNAFAT